MKRQIKLTENELKTVIRESVENLIREHMPYSIGRGAVRGLEQGKLGPWNAAQKIMNRDKWSNSQMNDFQKGFERKPIQQNETELEEYSDSEIAQGMNIYGRPSYDEDDFNEQPVNNIAAESKQYKVNESQLKNIIKESVIRILNEIGNEHPSGEGNYALALDAADKAEKLGRRSQASNLKKHAARYFNDRYGTEEFGMDDYGTVGYTEPDFFANYTPYPELDKESDKISSIDTQAQRNSAANALKSKYAKNSEIERRASIAKAYPRKRMTGGISSYNKFNNYMKNR